jgi:hypothetical protein
LELSQVPIIDFPESPEWNIENLQRLVLDRVEFPTIQDFKNFTGFLKKLHKLTDLSVAVQKEEVDLAAQPVWNEKRRKFIEVLSVLFLPPSLTKLCFEFTDKNQLDVIAILKVQNPGIEELTLIAILFKNNNKYSQFVKIFPNIDFPVGFGRQVDGEFLTPINSWTSLKELELNQATSYLLSQIKNLRSLKINKIDSIDNNNELFEFCLKNPDLERFMMSCDQLRFKNLKVIAENMPNLQVLILKMIWFGSYSIGSRNR